MYYTYRFIAVLVWTMILIYLLSKGWKPYSELNGFDFLRLTTVGILAVLIILVSLGYLPEIGSDKSNLIQDIRDKY